MDNNVVVDMTHAAKTAYNGTNNSNSSPNTTSDSNSNTNKNHTHSRTTSKEPSDHNHHHSLGSRIDHRSAAVPKAHHPCPHRTADGGGGGIVSGGSSVAKASIGAGCDENVAAVAAAAAFAEARLERAHYDVASAAAVAAAAAAASGDPKSLAAFGLLPTYLKDMFLAAHFLRGNIEWSERHDSTVFGVFRWTVMLKH